jgi:acyl-CoA synthetase (AMP-forming)/AMP-acid ligase II
MAEAPESIGALIERAAAQSRRAPALIAAETGAAIFYEELPGRVATIARRLDDLDIGLEEPVAFLLDNGLFTAELILGVMAAGRLAAPMNPAAGEGHISFALAHSEARVIFVAPEHRDLCEAALRRAGRTARLILADPDSGPEAPIGRSSQIPCAGGLNGAALFYTSGTTGVPKGVLLTHRGLLAGAAGTVRSHALVEADRSLCVLPLYHLNALVATLLPSLLSGGSLVLSRRFDPGSFWETVRKHQCTWFGLVPTLVSRLLLAAGDGSGSRAPTGVRLARCSAAPLECSQQLAFEERFGIPMVEAMGMTEAGATIFTQPLPPARRKLGSVGLPVGFEVRVVDGNGAAQPPGVSGELVIQGPSVMRGYFRDPDATSRVLDPSGWLHTGDLGHRDADGHFFITGRLKEMIVKAGENVAPREIDEALGRHPDVLEAAAAGIPDTHLGQDIAAWVVLRPGARCTERELQGFCAGEIGAFRTPTRLFLVEELPRGASGKVQRRALAESFARETEAGSDGPANEPASTDDLRHALTGIFAAVLGTPRVGVDDDFFELGGQSLLATQVIARVRDALGVDLPLSAVFEAPTAGALSLRIRRAPS